MPRCSQVVRTWFGRTIIRSAHQLSYQQAQDILDGKAASAGSDLTQPARQKLSMSLALLSRLAEKQKVPASIA